MPSEALLQSFPAKPLRCLDVLLDATTMTVATGLSRTGLE